MTQESADQKALPSRQQYQMTLTVTDKDGNEKDFREFMENSDEEWTLITHDGRRIPLKRRK